MFAFFEYIINVIDVIICSIFDMLDNFGYLLGQLAASVTFILVTVNELPSFCSGAIQVILIISVLSALVGSLIDLS